MSTPSAVAAVERLGGVARTRELRRAGVRRRDLTGAIRHGSLVRARTGVYALPDTPEPVMESLSHCGTIACVTASRAFGLWTSDAGEDELVHTWVDPKRHPVRFAIDPGPDDRRCCVFHRDEPVDPPSLQRVGVLHCLVQILGCKDRRPSSPLWSPRCANDS